MDKRDILSSVVWFTVSAFAMFSAIRLGVGDFHNPGSGFLPFFAGLFLLIFTLVMLVKSFLSGQAQIALSSHWKGLIWWKPVAVTAAVIIYILVMPKAGYLIATFFLMTVLFGIGGVRLKTLLIWSVASVAVSYFIFYKFLKVPLPPGLFSF